MPGIRSHVLAPFASVLVLVLSFSFAGVADEASTSGAEPVQLAQSSPYSRPQVPSDHGNRFLRQPRPQIPGVGEPQTCATQGYACPAGYLCRPVNERRPNQYEIFFECIPQSCGSNGCFVGYQRVDQSDGTYSCRPQIERGYCLDRRATWGQRLTGPGLYCQHIL
jgi:hypothetical protein